MKGNSMLKIALVNPSHPGKYSQPPMGLALIAAILEHKGYPVKIVDANALELSPENISHHVNDMDVVGLTAMTPTIGVATKVALHLKRSNPNLIIILGGAHGTLLPEETLARIPQIDVVVKGEGEKTIIDLLQCLEIKQPLDTVSGIAFRKGNEIISTPSKNESIDLNSLPFLAYHLLPYKKYKPHPPHGRAFPFAAVITSRGCPYRCSYCSKPVFGYKFRTQSDERVLEELTYYKKSFDVKEIAFYDDVFTLDKKRVHAIADGILKRNLRICWSCETRVNLVDKELLRHMKMAGCYAIAYGIESASQEILDILNKSITPEQVEEAIRITQDAGIQTIGYFMIGSPGESEKTIKKTIEFAKKLKLDFAQFSITMPFPGTKLYDIYTRDNKKEPCWDDFVYFGRTINTPIFESNALKRIDLQRWASRAHKEFYLRPAYLWQRVRQISTLADLKVNYEGFKMLLRA
jgi:radical SAM superfamily enzyme YgiQ (UPF0313 family)